MTPLVTKYIFILLQKLLNIIIVVLNHHGLDQKCSKHQKNKTRNEPAYFTSPACTNKTWHFSHMNFLQGSILFSYAITHGHKEKVQGE